MMELLSRPVGFELEYAGHSSSTQVIYETMRREGYTVCNFGGYRHTPASVSLEEQSWDLKTDSSCGWEAVSPVITTYAQLLRSARVADIVHYSGGTADSRTGLHVHIGVNHLPAEALNRFFRFMRRYEKAFFLLVPPLRRQNIYCKPIFPDNWKIIKDECDRMEEVNAALLARNRPLGRFQTFEHLWPDKNVWLNAKSFHRLGTIEFRLMPGTLNSNFIVGYIMFLQQVVDFVCHGKTVQWGTAKAKDDRMLFYTFLQQAGCYEKHCTFGTPDPDRQKLARDWAQYQYHVSNSIPRPRNFSVPPAVNISDVGVNERPRRGSRLAPLPLYVERIIPGMRQVYTVGGREFETFDQAQSYQAQELANRESLRRSVDPAGTSATARVVSLSSSSSTF